MALVATYGDINAFNVKVYDMAGGGYYATINDATTEVFKRRNSSYDYDIFAHVGATNTQLLDRFTSYSYDAPTATLTLTGAADTVNGVTFTRVETYRFVSAYVVEDLLTVSVDGNATINFTNWNYYPTADKIITLDNLNFGDGSTTLPLGIGVQLTAGGPIYGVIGDNNYESKGNNKKRALAARSGIAVHWVRPDDVAFFAMTSSTPLVLRQWFFKSTNTLYDFNLQGQLAVAAGKGYTGSTWEKICQVSSNWTLGVMTNLTDAMIVPSEHYVGMWMRDSFWSCLLTNVIPTAVETNVMATWDSVQQGNGSMPTSLYNTKGVFQTYHDESTILYIIRSYHNYIKRGMAPNMTVLTNCMNYIATQITSNQWRQNAGSTQAWIDTYIFGSGEYDGYTQGLYALAMKCALALSVPGASQSLYDNAVAQYRALYDTTNEYFKFSTSSGGMAPCVFAGEALSLYLFGIKMLDDIHVIKTIDRIYSLANTPPGPKCLAISTGGYYGGGSFSPSFVAGDYQNGASWFLYDYLMLYSGHRHGYGNASNLINRRIASELKSEPVSHEYICTVSTLPYYWTEPADRHVYAWNAASQPLRRRARQQL